jgi:CubicO group peptidase (beta-lactamase class C family)
MDLASTPGLAIVVVDSNEVVWSRAIGLANAETKAAIQADTVFPAASLGKPVFAWVVFKLVEEGKIDLDRPLVSYYRPEDLPDDPRLAEITARHVLSHTTGLRNWRNRIDQKLVPDFQPGSRFQYSGEGFYWLQQAVETVTGQPVDRVMRERLFEPANLPRATYGWSRDHDAWTAAGHTSRGAVGNQFTRTLGNKLIVIAEKWGKPISEWTSADGFRALPEADPSLPKLPNYVIPNVAGGLLCTAAEYARFMTLLHANRRPGPWEISEPSRTAMLSPKVELKPSLSWGQGVGLEHQGSRRFFWHWGDNGIYRNFMLGEPARGRGIAVFTNAEGGPKVYQRIITAATGLDLAAFLWV